MDINKIKDKIQQQALESHSKFNYYSTLCMCTGSGKSRCGVLRAIEVVKKNPNAKILLACFTTDQRDNVWRLEFEEWGAKEIYEKNVIERVCYVSLGKVKNQHFDLVIADEFHHITSTAIPFFETCQIDSILGLTATPPTDEIKKKIIDTVAPISFIYTTQQGIKDKVVANYEIHIIYTHLEEFKRTVTGGSKAKPFLQTEKTAYEYWDKVFSDKNEEIKQIMSEVYSMGYTDTPGFEFVNEKLKLENKEKINKLLKKKSFIESQRLKAISKRSNIIYNSYHKTRICKRLISEFCKPKFRYLFFAGSIKQSNEILPEMTYNSESNKDAYNDFMNEKINKLCAVRGLNEGTNIKNLDYGIISQLNSKELDMIQRIGRVIRIRDNHVGKIIIICLNSTRDKDWMKKALSNMKFVKVREYTEKEFFDLNLQQELF